jgi:hypothetical protein
MPTVPWNPKGPRPGLYLASLTTPVFAVVALSGNDPLRGARHSIPELRCRPKARIVAERRHAALYERLMIGRRLTLVAGHARRQEVVRSIAPTSRPGDFVVNRRPKVSWDFW